ncbi:MAG: YfhO family protein [Planctomycetes bacterium]|nr:YfhO family protein [Planctomycetota bacterium]
MDATQTELPSPPATRRELLLFATVLIALLAIYFFGALRPGWVLSPSDWLLATESFREPGSAEYEPANRLLTDITNQTEPWLELTAAEWGRGRVPLWNPYAGCGAPLLANSQSAVFFPLNVIYICTRSPYAWVVMAMMKLFIAGLGGFVFAREIGLGRLGRWFVGLCFPFSGFLVVWLQYALVNVAMWLPLVLWRVERLVQRPGPWAAGWLALVIGVMLLGGHPETAAHVLLVAGTYAAWRMQCVLRLGRPSPATQSLNRDPKQAAAPAAGNTRTVSITANIGWFVAAGTLGFLVAAVQLVPLAEYLGRGQSWYQRSRSRPGPLEIARPDILAMPALGAPYVYGSYRRGHPHVEKALGMHNFNDIAGGYSGLTTIAVLVPLALLARRTHRWVYFWVALDFVSVAVAYRFPLIDNLVRLIPILNITKNQRLLLVVSLAHCLLGAAGLEAWQELSQRVGRWLRITLVGLLLIGAAVAGVGGVSVRRLEPHIRQRALAHFEVQAHLRGLPADALQDRAKRLVQQSLTFFPRYYLGLAGYLILPAGLLAFTGRRTQTIRFPLILFVLTLTDLFLFGRGYNPAIPLNQYSAECSVVEFLRIELKRQSPEPFRVLPLEEEFPPNALGRFEIPDLRNYDCIEVRGNLAFFEPLWGQDSDRLTSNAWTSWERVLSNLERLRLANVRYLISTNGPPSDLSGVHLVHQHGRVGVYEIDRSGLFSVAPGGAAEEPGTVSRIPATIREYRPGYVEADVNISTAAGQLILAETFMPGWRAWVDGRRSEVTPYGGVFVSVPIGSGQYRVVFEYSPASFWFGLAGSLFGIAGVIGLLALTHGGSKPPG